MRKISGLFLLLLALSPIMLASNYYVLPRSSGVVAFSNTKSVQFNGTTSVLTSSTASNLDFDATSQAYSISFWIYRTINGSGQAVISRLILPNYTGPYYITSGGNNLAIQIASNENTSKYLEKHTTTAAVTNSSYHFAVMTYSGSALPGGITWYIDGSAQSAAGSGTLTTSTASGAAFKIGQDTFDSGGLFSGNLDEFAFWNVSLTSGNVTTLYNSGVPSNLSGVSFSANLLTWYRMGDAPGDSVSTIHDVVGSNDLTGTSLTISTLVP